MPPCLLLTRPRAAAEAFAQSIRAAGWRGEVLVAPLMRIAHLPLAEADLEGAATLIATSRHAIEALARATGRRDMRLWVVGPGTAAAAQAEGFEKLQVAGGDAQALLRDIAQAGARGPFLHLCGAHVAADIAGSLRRHDHEARAQIVYRQDALPLSSAAKARIRAGGDLLCPVFSPRSGRLLAAELSALDMSRARLHMVSISPNADAATAHLRGFSRRIAARPDNAHMTVEIIACQAKLEPVEKPS